MSAAIEETGCHLVAGEVIDRAERHPHQVLLLRILAQGYAELEALDLLGDVDQTLGVALDEMEALEVVAAQGEIGRMTGCVVHQLLVHDIAHEADAVFGVVVIDVAVDLILVDMLGEQLSDDEEDVGVGGVEGEATGIGHHAAIDGDGEVLVGLRKQS